MKKILKFTTAAIFFALTVWTAFNTVYHKGKAMTASKHPSNLHEAQYYHQLSNGTVQCVLCPNQCILNNDQWGLCKARKNIDGKLYSMVFGKITTMHVDPIEKKPFFHFLPGSKAYSIATTGCNMRCLFCQNWEISQAYPDDLPAKQMTPQDVVDEAKRSGSQSIAFTYNEPVINFEFMLETAKAARAAGVKTIVVSSGYIEQEPLKELLRHIDGYKVDFKAFHDEFYHKLTGGHVDPILEAMKTIKQSGVWLEIVNLLIPGQNDSDADIKMLTDWVKTNLGDEVPVHFSRYFPQYKLQNLPPTPEETVIRARKIAMQEGLKFVYAGNVASSDGESTFCPKSKEKVIERRGYFIISNHLKNGACSDGEKIPGVWK